MEITDMGVPDGDIPTEAGSDDFGSSLDIPPANDITPVDEIDAEFDAGDIPESNLLEPGAYATYSIPARGPDQSFTTDERDAIDSIGYTSGCHSCGTLDPETKSGHFIPDHQPPSALNTDNQPQELYPQCLSCSRQQGGQITAALS